MEIYLDFEKTLLRDDLTISKNTLHILEALAKKHKITILSTATLEEILYKINLPNVQIISTLENRIVPERNIEERISAEQINKIFENPYVYTAYTIDKETLIYSYQERLKYFYPNTNWKLVSHIEKPVSFLFLTIYNEGLENFKKTNSNLTIELLFQDATKCLLKLTPSPSTKKDWLLKLKESPAIGIGDSLSDYDFISCCEIQVAMKNSEPELKQLCKIETDYTNNEDGVAAFLISYLSHQPS